MFYVNIIWDNWNWHVIRIPYESLESISLHTSMYSNCEITIEEDGEIDLKDTVYPPEPINLHVRELSELEYSKPF